MGRNGEPHRRNRLRNGAARGREGHPLGVIHTPLVGTRRHSQNYSGDVQAMNVGDARIVEHVLGTRPSAATQRPLILHSPGPPPAKRLSTSETTRDLIKYIGCCRHRTERPA